jgi:hypothetical protein
VFCSFRLTFQYSSRIRINTPLDTDQNFIRLMHLSPKMMGSGVGSLLSCLTTNLSMRLCHMCGEISLIHTLSRSRDAQFPSLQMSTRVLRHLRLQDQERILWVDALCIYQDRYRTKWCRNLRFEPQFCEGVGLHRFLPSSHNSAFASPCPFFGSI